MQLVDIVTNTASEDVSTYTQVRDLNAELGPVLWRASVLVPNGATPGDSTTFAIELALTDGTSVIRRERATVTVSDSPELFANLANTGGNRLTHVDWPESGTSIFDPLGLDKATGMYWALGVVATSGNCRVIIHEEPVSTGR